MRLTILEVTGFALALGAAPGLGGCGGGGDDDIVDAGATPDQQDPIDLGITPAIADFGTVLFGGASAPETFTVTHRGGPTTSPLAVEIVSGDALDFRIAANHCTGKSLGPGDECTVEVELAPLCEGQLTSFLRVWDRSGWPEVRARLEGEGITPSPL